MTNGRADGYVTWRSKNSLNFRQMKPTSTSVAHTISSRRVFSVFKIACHAQRAHFQADCALAEFETLFLRFSMLKRAARRGAQSVA